MRKEFYCIQSTNIIAKVQLYTDDIVGNGGFYAFTCIGDHEVRMIMQTIQMYDVLEMKRVRKPGISLSVNYSYIPNDERNLVYKAAKLLMDEFQVKGGVDIHLEKFIPVAAGMAGGSSDAAAALVGSTGFLNWD